MPQPWVLSEGSFLWLTCSHLGLRCRGWQTGPPPGHLPVCTPGCMLSHFRLNKQETGPWGALARWMQILSQISWGLLWAFSVSSGIGSSRSAECELPGKARAALDCVYFTLLCCLGLERCKTSAAAGYNRYTVQAGQHACYNASVKHRVVLNKLEVGELIHPCLPLGALLVWSDVWLSAAYPKTVALHGDRQ